MALYLIFLSAFLFSGCSNRPSREKFPGPQGQTTDSNRAQSAREVMGGTDSFSKNLEKKAAKESQVSGQVSLGSKVKLPEKYFLFVSARRLTGGPPLAVKREKAPGLPYNFKLSQDDVMIPGTVLEGLVEVTARVDQDGDPLSRQEGDLVATGQFSVGQSGLNLELSPVQN